MPAEERTGAGWLTPSRRALLVAAGAVPVAAALGAGLHRSVAPLRLRPPELANPQRLVVTNAMLRAKKPIDLRGANSDWVLELPKDEPLEQGLLIHGRDEVRHIVVIGGAIRMRPTHDPKTMRLLDGSDWAAYAQRGFQGATGGSFRFQIWEKSYRVGLKPPVTADIPWDATPAMIAKALEDAAGAGAVQVVDGPSTPGGPWKIVPASNPLLGRVVLDTTGLQGQITPLERNFLNPAMTYALRLQQWRGTLHVEGLAIDGDDTCDGIQVQNHHKDAILQLANVHSAPRFHLWHDDWIHPDGAQFWLGPSETRMENVDMVSLGGNGLIAQPFVTGKTTPLESFRDWWFRNCHFRAIVDDRNGRVGDGSTACFRQESYPSAGQDRSGQRWICENVFCTRTRASTGAIIAGDPKDRLYRYLGDDPAGIRLGANPDPAFFADPKAGRSGLGYQSPGYEAASVPQGALRLTREQIVQRGK